ncbi:YqcI/YcgG family protein [Ketobacter sp. MCCC 1A13808]|uniref:YqcI/YcgG family protein n=1 Tax=Ketobacter sp. MCCC 1A13808 TaxID=2602738 RepID=UPI0012EB9CA0|nr:YqcI/YcgG family protein [Ketobacter sp. MCCC 1A13808]MVF14801.1 YqcI/YcgG family protein [Ketobacter sp. MCCC 1A13808]
MDDEVTIEAKERDRAIIPGKCYLFDETRLSCPDDLPWAREALQDFSEIMSDDDFPCLFGRKAWNNASIWFLFCERRESWTFIDFFNGLNEYTDFLKTTATDQRIYSPLIVFFSQDFNNKEFRHQSIGWEALNWAHRFDFAPWPHNIPLDPDHENWSFCFNGVQIFINMSSHDHTVLRSRNLGKYLTFVINARENFDAVASINTKSGRLIRERIRSRIYKYNAGVVPQELGFYGDPSNQEWRQYQLTEEGLASPDRCPFQPRKEIQPYENDKTE